MTERLKLITISEAAANNVLQLYPQIAQIAPLLKPIFKDLFLAGIIQGDLQRDVDLNKIFEYFGILK